MSDPAPLSATDRLAQALDALCAAVAARIGHPPMTAAWIVLIWTRLRRTKLRVLALAARIQAGTFRERPARPGQARRPAGATMPRAGAPLPRGFGWLVPLVPCAAACWAEAVRRVLAEPEMAALIAATPRMARLLRPLCHMLHIDPGVLPPRPARPRRRALPRPAEARPGRRAAAAACSTRTGAAPPVPRRAPGRQGFSRPTADVYVECFLVGSRAEKISRT